SWWLPARVGVNSPVTLVGGPSRRTAVSVFSSPFGSVMARSPPSPTAMIFIACPTAGAWGDHQSAAASLSVHEPASSRGAGAAALPDVSLALAFALAAARAVAWGPPASKHNVAPSAIDDRRGLIIAAVLLRWCLPPRSPSAGRAGPARC